MKSEDLSKISPDKITVKFRSYMRYAPKFKTNYVSKRARSSFLHIVHGKYEFHFNGGEIVAEDDDTVYLPEGSAYGYKLLSENAECIQLEFEAFYDGEAFGFSPYPISVIPENKERARNLFLKINASSGAFEKAAAIFELLDCFADSQISSISGEASRILPAIRYIEEHCTENIYVDDMAKLCFISQSQLRRLFFKELGMSPIEFKNHKRMELAINMLKYTYSRIGEVAESVGFDSIYVFSRVFTKHFGISPLNYRKSLKKIDKN